MQLKHIELKKLEIRKKSYFILKTRKSSKKKHKFIYKEFFTHFIKEATTMARSNILPVAAMEKLLKKAGAPRVSEEAKEALREVLEDKAAEIGMQALKFANHSGRKTIKRADIKLASK